MKDIAPAVGVLLTCAGAAAFWAHKLSQNDAAIKVMKEKMKVLKAESSEKMNVLKAESSEKINVLKAETREKINVLKAENNALEEKTRAEVAVAENRTMNKLLMFGFVEEYTKYQQKLKLFPSKFEVK